MIKVIIDTKYLEGKLKGIDFKKDSIISIRFIADKMWIRTWNKSISLGVTHDSKTECIVNQDGARWDWVYDLMKVVPSQPIVLQIHPKSVSVRFDY